MSRRNRRPRFDPVENDPPTPEWMPTGSMRRSVAEARRRMGEARWNQLNAEWN